jgi:hypothetical protein
MVSLPIPRDASVPAPTAAIRALRRDTEYKYSDQSHRSRRLREETVRRCALFLFGQAVQQIVSPDRPEQRHDLSLKGRRIFATFRAATNPRWFRLIASLRA